MFESTLTFRWDNRLVRIPTSFQGGPGTTEKRVFLQQLWKDPCVVYVEEWRDVPGLEGGLKA